jgi:FtsZ-binding cell division protein ZapB
MAYFGLIDLSFFRSSRSIVSRVCSPHFCSAGQSILSTVNGLQIDMAEVKRDIDIIKHDVSDLKRDVSDLKRDVSDLKRSDSEPEDSLAAALAMTVSIDGTGCGTLVQLHGRSYIATVAHNVLDRGRNCLKKSKVRLFFRNQTVVSVSVHPNLLIHEKFGDKGVDLALIRLPRHLSGGMTIGRLQQSKEMLGVAYFPKSDAEPSRGPSVSYVYGRMRNPHRSDLIFADLQGSPGYSGVGLIQNQSLVALHVDGFNSFHSSTKAHANAEAAVAVADADFDFLETADAESAATYRKLRQETIDACSQVSRDSSDPASAAACFTKLTGVMRLLARNPLSRAALAEEFLPDPITGERHMVAISSLEVPLCSQLVIPR